MREVHRKVVGKVFEKTKASASAYRREFRKQTLTAVTAAFGFLIALTWKDPITEGVTNIVSNLNLDNQLVYYKFLLAFIVTAICVIFLVLLSRWSADEQAAGK